MKMLSGRQHWEARIERTEEVNWGTFLQVAKEGDEILFGAFASDFPCIPNLKNVHSRAAMHYLVMAANKCDNNHMGIDSRSMLIEKFLSDN